MSMSPPDNQPPANQSSANQVDIKISDSGIYKDMNPTIAFFSKLFLIPLAVWAIVMPEDAAAVLGAINTLILSNLAAYYVYVMAFFLVFCLAIALYPRTGKVKLGNVEPEFSRVSWLAMMFGAGMGIGIITYSIAEPLYHMDTNPLIIEAGIAPRSAEAVEGSFRYAFLHWGFAPWAVYACVGFILAYFAYNKGYPLTIRSAFAPFLGEKINGFWGNVIDVFSVISVILGIGAIVGLGASLIVSGAAGVTEASWLMQHDASGATTTIPTKTATLCALGIVMVISICSAISGVARGIKWISNLNIALSFVILIIFFLFGATSFSVSLFFSAFIDYCLHLPALTFELFDKGTKAGDWQRAWSVYYWAWWISVAPAVGLFIARISKGRTLRELILCTLTVPTIFCFLWLSFPGGTAIDLVVQGIANTDAFIFAGETGQPYATLHFILSSGGAKLVSAIVVLLIFTYQITTVDSGVLVLNTIMAGGNENPPATHRVIWGMILAALVAGLLLSGGLNALKIAMVLGALPFSFFMLIMCAAVVKMLFADKGQ